MGMVLHHGSRRWHRAKEVSGIFLSLALSDIISINSVTINEINFLSNQIGNNINFSLFGIITTASFTGILYEVQFASSHAIT